jgi:RNA-binding protein YlmH
MNAFDVESFVAEMDRMGVRLSAVPLADGTVRVNRWRTMSAVEHGYRIDHLWGSQVAHDRARMDTLAAHLMKRAA